MSNVVCFAEKVELRRLERLRRQAQREVEARARRAELAARMDEWERRLQEPMAPTFLGGPGDYDPAS
jgi:hypothetical protein